MTIYDYLESIDMDWTAKSRLYAIITGRQDNQNVTFANYMAKSRNTEMPADFRAPKEELLDLLVTVNKMVKDAEANAASDKGADKSAEEPKKDEGTGKKSRFRPRKSRKTNTRGKKQ